MRPCGHFGVEELMHMLIHGIRGFRSASIQAVMAATKRSMQLGNIPEDEIRHVHNL